MSCRKEETESYPDGGEFLAVQNLGADSVRETQTRRIQCLRWRVDNRELIAVVGDQRGLSVVTFAADELVQVSEVALPVEPTARGISISPNADYVSFCDFPSDDDSPDDAPYSGYIYGLADGRMLPIGPQCLDTRPVWSPTGRWLACRGWKEAGQNSRRMVAIIDPAVRETVEIASANSDDLSGDQCQAGPTCQADPAGDERQPVPVEERRGRWLHGRLPDELAGPEAGQERFEGEFGLGDRPEPALLHIQSDGPVLSRYRRDERAQDGAAVRMVVLEAAIRDEFLLG